MGPRRVFCIHLSLPHLFCGHMPGSTGLRSKGLHSINNNPPQHIYSHYFISCFLYFLIRDNGIGLAICEHSHRRFRARFKQDPVLCMEWHKYFTVKFYSHLKYFNTMAAHPVKCHSHLHTFQLKEISYTDTFLAFDMYQFPNIYDWAITVTLLQNWAI